MGINWKRKLFHIVSALFCWILTAFLTETSYRLTLFILLLLVAFLEYLRLAFPKLLPLKSLWEPLLREREREGISDALWFVLGLFLASLIAPFNYLQTIVLILGISDPLAEFIGRRWGKIKIKGDKTLEGALGFSLSAFFIALFFLPFNPWEILLFLVIPLTMVELLTIRDNLWIPLSGALILRIF